MNFDRLRWTAGIAASVFVAAPSAAHHSNALFDMTRSVTLRGTVKEFQWTNPHVFIQLLVPAGGGGAVEWSIETDAPAILYRKGWRPGTVKAGDEATLAVHPVRHGTNAGELVSGTLSNGTRLVTPESGS